MAPLRGPPPPAAVSADPELGPAAAESRVVVRAVAVLVKLGQARFRPLLVVFCEPLWAPDR